MRWRHALDYGVYLLLPDGLCAAIIAFFIIEAVRMY